MSNVRKLVREAVTFNTDSSPHDIAQLLADKLTETQVRECVLGHLASLAAECFQHDRQAVMKEFSPTDQSMASTSSKNDVTTSKVKTFSGQQESGFLAARRSKFSMLMWVPGVGNVRFGNMTVEHHEAVISHLTATVVGLNERVAGHQRAISQIENAGVECLNEVPDASEAEYTRIAG